MYIGLPTSVLCVSLWPTYSAPFDVFVSITIQLYLQQIPFMPSTSQAWVFTKTTRPILEHVQLAGHRLSRYLNDFIGGAHPEQYDAAVAFINVTLRRWDGRWPCTS